MAAFRFAPFGTVATLLGMLYVYALACRGVLRRSEGWQRVLLTAYWVVATAMMFRVLLPPPGLVQVGLAIWAVIGAWLIIRTKGRERAALWLGIVAVSLAVVRFALVSIYGYRSDLPDWGPLQLGAATNALRDVLVAYTPEQPFAEAIHVAALVSYAVALWVQWGEADDSLDSR